MIEALASAADWIVQLLLKILPDSFITDWLSGLDFGLSSVATGLRYLNWFVDVNGMLIVMDLWLLGLLAYYSWRFSGAVFNAVSQAVTNVAGWLPGGLSGLLPGGDGE